MNHFPTPKSPEQLRQELEDYYGTAMFGGFPAAMIDLDEIEDMDEEEPLDRAEELGLL